MPRSLALAAPWPIPLRSSILCALIALGTTQAASAQLVTYTSRNGQDLVACGPQGGPFVSNSFSTPTETHEAIAVSDPGSLQWSASEASATFDATPTQSGITLAGTGHTSRDAIIEFASGATADTRDNWFFTVSATTRFSFLASLSATNSAGPMPSQSYLFAAFGGGAQVILDPGIPPTVLGGALFSPGTLIVTATGTLTPGQYVVSLQGRAEGTNVWPHDGSFDNFLSLAFDSTAATTYCTSGTTTHGCTAQISGSGTASATASSGFTLAVTGMEGAMLGLIFYGVTGRSELPWGAGSSFLCVQPPLERMPVLGSGGTPGACDGSMSFDWNSFVSSHPGAIGTPFSAGAVVNAQAWFRDPPSPAGTNLSNGIEFVVSP
jgi:hypothetical protein